MSNLPKNPKPHIGEEEIIKPTKTFNYKKVIKEMVELIRENNNLIAKHTRKNETAYR